jgi:hypothetical protein
MNRERNEPIDENDEHCNASSHASSKASDEKMDDCPVDMVKENNSLCPNMLSGNMEPHPGKLLLINTEVD